MDLFSSPPIEGLTIKSNNIRNGGVYFAALPWSIAPSALRASLLPSLRSINRTRPSAGGRRWIRGWIAPLFPHISSPSRLSTIAPLQIIIRTLPPGNLERTRPRKWHTVHSAAPITDPGKLIKPFAGVSIQLVNGLDLTFSLCFMTSLKALGCIHVLRVTGPRGDPLLISPSLRIGCSRPTPSPLRLPKPLKVMIMTHAMGKRARRSRHGDHLH